MFLTLINGQSPLSGPLYFPEGGLFMGVELYFFIIKNLSSKYFAQCRCQHAYSPHLSRHIPHRMLGECDGLYYTWTTFLVKRTCMVIT